jgi:hypothetical protein
MYIQGQNLLLYHYTKLEVAACGSNDQQWKVSSIQCFSAHLCIKISILYLYIATLLNACGYFIKFSIFTYM